MGGRELEKANGKSGTGGGGGGGGRRDEAQSERSCSNSEVRTRWR